MQDLIAKARQLAEKVHRGQVDKAGKDYIHHPETVASFVFKDEEKVVAWLHDTVEDTDVTLDYIRAEFGDVIAEAVDHVTHRPGEEWGDYIDRVKQNPLSREVKLAELTHNMDITRLQNPDEKDHAMVEKYIKTEEFLRDTEYEHYEDWMEYQYNKDRCPVCGKYTFDMEYGICPVCGWENDGVQGDDHDEMHCANTLSVNQARILYAETGKCEPGKDLDLLEWLHAHGFKDEFEDIDAKEDTEPDQSIPEDGIRYGYVDPDDEDENMKLEKLLSKTGQLKTNEINTLTSNGQINENHTNPQNRKKAVQYYRKAAENGGITACNNLGWMLREGIGCKKNVAEAIIWFEKAAMHGFGLAAVNLGSIYEHGELDGTPDYEKAVDWYERGIKIGSTGCEINLGIMYFNGSSVLQDYEKAYRYFSHLSDMREKTGYYFLALYAQYGYLGETDYTLALEYYRKAMKLNDAYSFCNAASLYEDGLGTESDFKMAASLLMRAAELGDDLAYYNLGHLAEIGIDGDPDVEKAISFYKYAVSRFGQKNAKAALERLGDICKDIKALNPLKDKYLKRYSGLYKEMIDEKNSIDA